MDGYNPRANELANEIEKELLTDDTRARAIVNGRILKGLTGLLLNSGLVQKADLLDLIESQRGELAAENASLYSEESERQPELQEGFYNDKLKCDELHGKYFDGFRDFVDKV